MLSASPPEHRALHTTARIHIHRLKEPYTPWNPTLLTLMLTFPPSHLPFPPYEFCLLAFVVHSENETLPSDQERPQQGQGQEEPRRREGREQSRTARGTGHGGGLHRRAGGDAHQGRSDGRGWQEEAGKIYGGLSPGSPEEAAPSVEDVAAALLSR